LEFLPKLLGFLLILVIGYVVAKLIAKIIAKVLQKVGFDRAVEKGLFDLDRARFRFVTFSACLSVRARDLLKSDCCEAADERGHGRGPRYDVVVWVARCSGCACRAGRRRGAGGACRDGRFLGGGVPGRAARSQLGRSPSIRDVSPTS